MTAIAMLPDGTLRRLEEAERGGLPPGTVVWVSAEAFAQNCRPEAWFPHLLSSRPDLCNVEDVRIRQQAWRAANVWPALLALAGDPEAPAPTQGPPQDGEDEMAKSKKAKTTKSAPAPKKEKLVRKAKTAEAKSNGHVRVSVKDARDKADFLPVRAGTTRAKVVELLRESPMSFVDLAKKLGTEPHLARTSLFCLWRDNGFGYRIENGVASIVIPAGVTPIKEVKIAA
jgi:hypothetical protein